jgi:hypothetical protein
MLQCRISSNWRLCQHPATDPASAAGSRSLAIPICSMLEGPNGLAGQLVQREQIRSGFAILEPKNLEIGSRRITETVSKISVHFLHVASGRRLLAASSRAGVQSPDVGAAYSFKLNPSLRRRPPAAPVRSDKLTPECRGKGPASCGHRGSPTNSVILDNGHSELRGKEPGFTNAICDNPAEVCCRNTLLRRIQNASLKVSAAAMPGGASVACRRGFVPLHEVVKVRRDLIYLQVATPADSGRGVLRDLAGLAFRGVKAHDAGWLEYSPDSMWVMTVSSLRFLHRSRDRTGRAFRNRCTR